MMKLENVSDGCKSKTEVIRERDVYRIERDEAWIEVVKWSQTAAEARRERDEARADATRWESAYNDIRKLYFETLPRRTVSKEEA